MYYSDTELQRSNFDDITVIGYEPTTRAFCAVPDVDRYSGMYVIGTQGNGKSGLLINCILQDVNRDRPVVVWDPHGDLVDDCLKRLPVWAIPKTYVLDMLDESYPFGVNLFAHGRLDTDADQTQVVERILHVFTLLWPEVESQQNLPRYLRQAVLVLLVNPGATLVDMYELLTDQEVRARLLKRVKDPTVKQFWKRYDKMGEAKQTATVLPLLTRLESLFTGRTLIRNIVGQKVTSISFRRAIQDKEFIFIKLPTKKLAADAELIGRVLFSQLAADIFSFGNLPPDERPGVSVYVDEAQHFANDDVETLYSEGRKFGVRLVIAHQRREQLSAKLRDATMSARIKVVFQTTPDDGKEMASLFPDAGGEFEINPHASAYLLEHPEEFPVPVRVFIEYYLRPFQSSTRGGKVTIKYPEETLSELLLVGTMKPISVSSPIPALDMLLKEVMRQGTAELPIPPQAVEGFAACGRGFHKAFRSMWTPRILYQPGYTFGRHLANANVWKREPEDALEQLQHFIYHLRHVMRWLAKHPVGTQSRATASDVGRMLSSLPRRVAFVRSGTEGGVMRTLDTPQAVGGEELDNRLRRVVMQSRVKYAHPRAQIEHDEEADTGVSVSKTDDDSDAAPPRWEDVS